MYKKKKFSEDEIKKANEVSILSLVKNLGLKTEKKKNAYKAPGYGGLYIDEYRNQWNCFAAQLSGETIYGGGPIQLVQFILGYDFVQAMKYLLNDDHMDTIHERQPNTVKVKKEFKLPAAAQDYRHVYAYLIKTRGINHRIVDYFVKTKKLYENTHYSCVFVGYDQFGVARHCTIRGTVSNNPFKGEVESSDKRFTFCMEGTTDTLHIYEAPIDLMSYLTLCIKWDRRELWKDHHLARCCLANVPIETYLKRFPQIRKLIFHLDNDKWGKAATERFAKEYQLQGFETWAEHPDTQYKDFNEQLVIEKNLG